MKNILKKEQGITLIALVTAIIILLILSGITIGMLSSENGLINQSYQSSQDAQKESIIEKIEADLYSEKTITGKIPNESKLIEIAEKYGTVDNNNKSINIPDTEIVINFSDITGWDADMSAKTEFQLDRAVFDGTNYINTGICLFSKENIHKDFELSFEIKSMLNVSYATPLDMRYNISGQKIGFAVVDRENTLKLQTQNIEQNNYRYDSLIKINEIPIQGVKIKIRREYNALYYSVDDQEEILIMDYTQMGIKAFDVPLIFGAAWDDDNNPKDFMTGELQNIKVKVKDMQPYYIETKTDNAYKLNGEITFSGSNHINTGMELFSEENFDRNFEISFDLISMDQNINVATLMNAKDEKESPWPGFLIRYSSEKDDFEISATNTAKISARTNKNTPKKIKFKRINHKLYYSIDNENYIELVDFSTIAWKFDIPVTFGASLTNSTNRNPQRFFKGKVANISVEFLN